MNKYYLTEIQPKVPAQLLENFLKGIGCKKVKVEASTALETWIDFEFMGGAFKAHRNFEAWSFFAENDYPPELVSALVKKIRVAQKTMWAWVAVCKGIF